MILICFMVITESPIFLEQAHLPHTRRSSLWYKDVFEESWAKLKPYPDGKVTMDAGTTKSGFYPQKLTSTLIHVCEEERLELLINNQTESGYIQGNHEKIQLRYQCCHSDAYLFKSTIFEDGQGRNLIVEAFDRLFYVFLQYDGENNLIKMMERYQIKKIYGQEVEGTGFTGVDQTKLISLEEIIDHLNPILFSDFTAGLAAAEGWSNFEWLRYRQTGEPPERYYLERPKSYPKLLPF